MWENISIPSCAVTVDLHYFRLLLPLKPSVRILLSTQSFPVINFYIFWKGKLGWYQLENKTVIQFKGAFITFSLGGIEKLQQFSLFFFLHLKFCVIHHASYITCLFCQSVQFQQNLIYICFSLCFRDACTLKQQVNRLSAGHSQARQFLHIHLLCYGRQRQWHQNCTTKSHTNLHLFFKWHAPLNKCVHFTTTYFSIRLVDKMPIIVNLPLCALFTGSYTSFPFTSQAVTQPGHFMDAK